MAGSLDWDETTTSNIFFSDEGELAISTGRDVAQPEPSESKRSEHSKELPTDIDFDFHTTHMLELGGRTRGRLLQDKEEAGAFVRMVCCGWVLDDKTPWSIDREQKFASPVGGRRKSQQRR